MDHQPAISADPKPVLDKPDNGWRGLKHWRHDMAAGLMVSLVSLPFSLGIAVASGAPPIAGLISAIIAWAAPTSPSAVPPPAWRRSCSSA
jgi:hypothetical protein